MVQNLVSAVPGRRGRAGLRGAGRLGPGRPRRGRGPAEGRGEPIPARGSGGGPAFQGGGAPSKRGTSCAWAGGGRSPERERERESCAVEVWRRGRWAQAARVGVSTIERTPSRPRFQSPPPFLSLNSACARALSLFRFFLLLSPRGALPPGRVGRRGGPGGPRGGGGGPAGEPWEGSRPQRLDPAPLPLRSVRVLLEAQCACCRSTRPPCVIVCACESWNLLGE